MKLECTCEIWVKLQPDNVIKDLLQGQNPMFGLPPEPLLPAEPSLQQRGLSPAQEAPAMKACQAHKIMLFDQTLRNIL